MHKEMLLPIASSFRHQSTDNEQSRSSLQMHQEMLLPIASTTFCVLYPFVALSKATFAENLHIVLSSPY